MVEDLNLTNNQEEAISHTEGLLRVIACPGSGKTEIIARRIATLISKGEEPSGIVAITFTEKAAEELKTRIRKILQDKVPERADIGDMFVGTIHAFSLEMLRELDPYYRTYDVLDDAQRVAFVSKSMNYYNNIKLVRLEKHYGMKYYRTISKFLKSVDIMLMERLDPSQIEDERFSDCFAAYKKQLEDERYFDFSTIISTLVSRLSSDDKSLALISHRTRHVIVDEFQDVDKLQNELLRLLSGKAKSLCVVGDDDQGIYNWRGTDVKIIRDFGTSGGYTGDPKDVVLDTNFRSTADIVKLARKFIEHNKQRLPKSMEPNRKLLRPSEKGDIQYGYFDKDDEELDFIISRIKELVGTDFTDKTNRKFSLSYGDFAVLTRTNEWASKIIDHFEENSIKCIATSGESIFERPEVVFALNCIAYVFDCNGYDTGGNIPEIESLRERYSRLFPTSKYPDADQSDFVKKIQEIRLEVQKIREEKKTDYLPELGLQGFYHKIMQSVGADRFDLGEVYNYNFACLSQTISDYESVWTRLAAGEVKYFFNFVHSYAYSAYTDPRHQDPSILDAVRVMTIHKAKGLEFPVVFVPDLVKKQHKNRNDNFIEDDQYDSVRYSGNEEDERRVIYTALTRSEKYLFISGSRCTEGKVRPRPEHKFIDELDRSVISDPEVLEKKRSGLEQRLVVDGEYSTSYSQLISYIRCPEDFLLRNVYGYNAGVPAAFGYGTNIHNILNLIHRDYIRSGKIPSEEEIVNIVKGTDKSRGMFNLRYATGPMTENMLKGAVTVIQNYVGLHSGDFERILETEKRFEFVLGEALITGQIDLLKKLNPEGDLSEVEVIDFKTEKENGRYSADYERQLRYYAIACLEALDLRPEKAVVHHLDDDSHHSVDISEHFLNTTKSEVGQIVGKILKKQFPATPEKTRCEGCDYLRLCSYKVS